MTAGQLAGRTAIVTGASRGIGLAIAEAFVAAGANVVLTARTQEAAAAAALSLDGGPRAVGYAAHATDGEAAAACVEFARQRFGSLDILVNNAGTNAAFGPLVAQDHPRFAKTIDVNLYAPLLWTQLAWRGWMADHGGSIINMASVGGLAVTRDLGVYDVSKAALIHLTRQLALELGPAARVNAIAPGVVRTRLSEALWKQDERSVAGATPLQRIGEPRDVADAATFLASDQSRWITGTTVVVDGGQLLVGDVAEARLEDAA
jgi:NAD(P)-dependent dehydrogenase (short-subunit alcohol dehydrogenase family)